MIKLSEGGAFLLNGADVVEVNGDTDAVLESRLGKSVSREDAAKNTIAYGILKNHNTSGNLVSPDALAVCIIPTKVISCDVSLSNFIISLSIFPDVL